MLSRASLLAVSLIVSALRQRRLSAGPPRRAPPIRVGFVGNSFTYYNDLPGVLSRATGVAVDACTRGGASLASLLRDGGDGTGLAAVRFAKAALARARGADASTKEKAEAAEAQRVAGATDDVPAAARSCASSRPGAIRTLQVTVMAGGASGGGAPSNRHLASLSCKSFAMDRLKRAWLACRKIAHRLPAVCA